MALKEMPKAIRAGDFVPVNQQRAKIGQFLFYDKILSGNRNISCATCHHPRFGGADGVSLGIGEGGQGVGPKRIDGHGAHAVKKRIPRNAPALWNIGHKSVRNLFHDGRLSRAPLYQNGFNSPAEEWLPRGLESLAAAQALFPLVAQFEMAGNPKENEIAGALHDRIDAAWPIIAHRVNAIEEYRDMFAALQPAHRPGEAIDIVDIANALGDFMNFEWRSYDSAFDRALQGHEPLTAKASRGMALFFGKAQCVRCHSGPLFTDQGFYALALPAFGPGRTRVFDPIPRDVGQMGESDLLQDAYRFRTPSLRNVALTAPYGHNGAFDTLEKMIWHHVNPVASRSAWQKENMRLPEVSKNVAQIDFIVQQDRFEMQRQAAKIDIDLPKISEVEIDEITAFLHSLTGEAARKGTLVFGIPDQVPSGLPVDR